MTERAPKPAAFYDDLFARSPVYAQPHDACVYTPIWGLVALWLEQAQVRTVLDLGCGPGHLAQRLRSVVGTYYGLDFSAEALRQARAACPMFRFELADFELDSVRFPEPYDAVTALETLEHLQRDEATVARIRPGALVIVSVPAFDAAAHVRWFPTVADAAARYAPWVEWRAWETLALGPRARVHVGRGVRRALAPCRLSDELIRDACVNVASAFDEEGKRR